MGKDDGKRSGRAKRRRSRSEREKGRVGPKDDNDRRGHRIDLGKFHRERRSLLPNGIYTLEVVSTNIEDILGRHPKCDGKKVVRKFKVVSDDPEVDGVTLADPLAFPDRDRDTAFYWHEWLDALGEDPTDEVFPGEWIGKRVKAKVVQAELKNGRIVNNIKGFARFVDDEDE